MISYLLLQRIKEHLTTKLGADVGSIKIGRFQSDPVGIISHIAISTGNTRDDTTRDGIVSLGEMNNIGVNFPAREIGGGQFWWRRGVLDIAYYGIKEALGEEASYKNAFDFLGKVQSAMDTIKVSDITETVNNSREHALQCFVYAGTFNEGGGPKNRYIFRGQLFWQVLTARY